MNFTSVLFIFQFFPVTFFLYHISSEKIKNVILVIASLVFFASGNLEALPFLLITICVNYIFGLLIGRAWKKEFIKKIFLIFSLIWNIGGLFYFKYLNVLAISLIDVLNLELNISEIIFPIGISFFTFRCISYCVDIFWEISTAKRNILDVALYISFFPQLLMGPITKWRDFECQLKNREVKFEDIASGIKRIIIGLTKKLFIANRIGIVVDIVFSMDSTERSVILAWFAVFGYLIQLYYDFSGYSDIAIGLGSLFGFKTPENFKYPYTSKGIIEFWNSWHVTLGEWFREYMFTPLFRFFQLRKIPFNVCNYLSLFIVWIIVGIWHGAGVKFVVYGLFYVVFILIERIISDRKKVKKKQNSIKKKTSKLKIIWLHIYFMIVVSIGQLLFRSDTLQTYCYYLKDLVGLNGNSFFNLLSLYYIKSYWLTLAIGIVFAFPLTKYISSLYKRSKSLCIISEGLKVIVYCAMWIISISYMIANTSQSFIYFQF